MTTVVKAKPKSEKVSKQSLGFIEEKQVEIPILFEVNNVDLDVILSKEIADYKITTKCEKPVKFAFVSSDNQNVQTFIKSYDANTFIINTVNTNDYDVQQSIKYIAFY